MKFLENLDHMNAEVIRKILRLLGEKKLPTRKADLAAMLHGIWIDEPQRLIDKTGNPTAATVRKVGEALCVPDLDIALPTDCTDRPWDERDVDPGPVRAFAWPVLLQQCGWAKPKGGKLQLTKAGKAMRDDFTFERYAEGVSRLIEMSPRDELRRVNVIKGFKTALRKMGIVLKL